jgi:hypothetical protein
MVELELSEELTETISGDVHIECDTTAVSLGIKAQDFQTEYYAVTVHTDGGSYDAYGFRAEQGQRVIITLNSDDFDPLVRVGRMAGGDFVELAHNDDGPDQGLNSRLVFTAPTAGDYVIRATAVQDGTGAYTIGLAPAPDAPPAKPLVIGDKVEGELNADTGANDDGQRALDVHVD